MTTPPPRDQPGVRSDVPGTRVTGTGPAAPSSAPPPSAPPSAPAGAPPAGTAAAPPARRRRGAGRSIGLGLAAVLLVFVTVVLVLFVLFNTQRVQVSLVFGEVQAPLVIALLVAAGLGALLVLLLGAVLRARRSSRG